MLSVIQLITYLGRTYLGTQATSTLFTDNLLGLYNILAYLQDILNSFIDSQIKSIDVDGINNVQLNWTIH